MRILHAKPETACAKMSEFSSFCAHHVTLNGEAVKSNMSLSKKAERIKNGWFASMECDKIEERSRR